MIACYDVETQKAVWVEVLSGLKQRLVDIATETDTVNRQILTVEGAIQACDIIIQKDVKDS